MIDPMALTRFTMPGEQFFLAYLVGVLLCSPNLIAMLDIAYPDKRWVIIGMLKIISQIKMQMALFVTTAASYKLMEP